MKIKPAIYTHQLIGKKVNLRIAEKGECFITLKVLNEKVQIEENVEFLIDTGFNGYLQLNKVIIDKLKLTIIKKDKTKDSQGIEHEVGIINTKIKLLDTEIFNFPIQIVDAGPCLIGTSLLKAINMALVFDWGNNFLGFTQDKKVKKRIRKSFN
ncbi:MAG: hypothetical protein WC621_04920 [Patescibacteria group bacterium]